MAHGRYPGPSTSAVAALLLALTLAGCGSFRKQPATPQSGDYCLSSGKEQSYDCSKPVAEPYVGPLRIRDLPIDDATLYARVEEIKRWLAQQRAILSGELPEQAIEDTELIPAAPEAEIRAESTPEETLAAALALAERGDYSSALSLIDQYRALNPQDLSATLIESRILFQSGEAQSAAELLRRAIKQDPQVPELYNNLAAIQAANGDVGDAITTLQQAFATHPSFAKIQKNLKTLYTESAHRALLPDSTPATPKLEMIDQTSNR